MSRLNKNLPLEVVFIRYFIRWSLKLVVLFAMIYFTTRFGLKSYFTMINPIATEVQNDVATRAAADHSPVLTYSQIPEMYRNAAIATEDRRFFTNSGVDLRGIWRAVLVDVWRGRPLQGASTITQQLIHNTILNDSPKSLVWKLKEMADAMGLTMTMPKSEVFTLYANDIYFGEGAYGLYDASMTYFGVAPSRLNSGELTMLAGLPNAPSDYDPFRNLALARQRQILVVSSMVRDGAIGSAEAATIMSEPIRLR